MLCFAVTVYAHPVSLSTGELHMDGPTATFDLRIPMYEVAQTAHPETELLAHFRFGDGHLARSTCRVGTGPDDGAYICHGEYEFPSLHPDALEVECTLFDVTVPNHIHMLTATQISSSGREFTDQEVFDRRFTTIEVRFRPPSTAEAMLRGAVSGAIRAIESVFGMLCVAGLALAARGWKEALLFFAVYASAELGARRLGTVLPVAVSANFLEAVLALMVAYLAVEILLLPQGSLRLVLAVMLGLCQGVLAAGFPAAYWMGAMPAEAAIFAAMAAVALGLQRPGRLAAASILLAAGLGVFGSRVWR